MLVKYVKQNIFLILYGIPLIWLAITVAQVGMYYTFDFDELYHSQIVYLLVHHAVPYQSFYLLLIIYFLSLYDI